MDLSKLMWAAVKAFIVALVLTPIIRDIFRAYNVVDRPGQRTVHAYPIPRVGGGPIAIAYAVSLLALFDLRNPPVEYSEALTLLPGVAIIFLTGLLDDFLNLRPIVKLIGQIAAAAVVFMNGLRIEAVGGLVLPAWLPLPLTIFWLLLCTNALNLIDGLDGLCGGMGFLVAVTLFATGLIQHNLALMYTMLPLSGALLGFLFFNFNPATVFLGDSGALMIGFLLGCAGILWTNHSLTPAGIAVPLLALSVPMIDLLLSIVRRFLKGQPIFSADRGHIHHRLLDRGLTPRRAAVTLYLIATPGIAAALLLSYPLHAYFHIAGISAFFLITAAGIIQLRYPEFEVAARLVFLGDFRRVLAGRVRVKQLGSTLQQAKSEDQWWATLVKSGREQGWTRLTWRRNHSSREQVFSPHNSAWSFQIALSDEDSLLVEGGQPARVSFDLVSFSEILRRTFPSTRREWEQPTLS